MRIFRTFPAPPGAGDFDRGMKLKPFLTAVRSKPLRPRRRRAAPALLGTNRDGFVISPLPALDLLKQHRGCNVGMLAACSI